MNDERRPRPAVTLVVPCYNEASRLDVDAFVQALEHLPHVHLHFVDDGSTDQTADVVGACCARMPSRMTLQRLTSNVGKAEAVRLGMLAVCAAPQHEATVCGFWDADLSAALTELPAMLQVYEHRPGVEWVWAIRLKALGRDVTRGALRHYLGRVFATVASALTGIAAYDTQCGAKLFRVSPLLRAVLSQPFRSRWVFDVELLTRADAMLRAGPMATHGVERIVYELPLQQWHHRDGSKVRSTDFLRAALELFVIWKDRDAWRRPVSDVSPDAVR